MADNLVAAPEFMLTLLLTMTEVKGIPPTNPDKVLPIPWAINSLFGEA